MHVLDAIAVLPVELADVEARDGRVARVQDQIRDAVEVLQGLGRMEAYPAVATHP